MTECLAPALMLAALRGREHETTVLDGARANEHMPVRFAGLAGKRRWNADEGCAVFRQRAVERWEAQVVAHGQSEPTPRQVGDDADLGRPVAARLPIALAFRQVDVEHMDLVVARDDLALRIDQERAVRRPV